MKILFADLRIQVVALLLPLLISCADQYSAEKAAQDYCECMKANGSPEQYKYAFTVCEGEMVKKYHYYKLFYVDMADEKLDKKVGQTARDSAQIFMGRFMKCINENLSCCRETLSCPDGDKK